jgi:hypothetical protein
MDFYFNVDKNKYGKEVPKKKFEMYSLARFLQDANFGLHYFR